MKRRDFVLFAAALLTGGSLAMLSDEVEASKQNDRRNNRDKHRNAWMGGSNGHRHNRHDRYDDRDKRRKRNNNRNRYRNDWQRPGQFDCSACK